MTAKNENSSFINVCFLVGGTCVGGGMLALPVSTSLIGFGLEINGYLHEKDY